MSALTLLNRRGGGSASSRGRAPQGLGAETTTAPLGVLGAAPGALLHGGWGSSRGLFGTNYMELPQGAGSRRPRAPGSCVSSPGRDSVGPEAT